MIPSLGEKVDQLIKQLSIAHALIKTLTEENKDLKKHIQEALNVAADIREDTWMY